jgi:hypothetical protein
MGLAAGCPLTTVDYPLLFAIIGGYENYSGSRCSDTVLVP